MVTKHTTIGICKLNGSRLRCNMFCCLQKCFLNSVTWNLYMSVHSLQACRMAQSDSKVLVLGALAGVAGISLAVVCYQGFKSRRRGSSPGLYLTRTNEQGVMLVDGPVVPRGQAEVLERLEALIQCVSELKDEMKALKNALPTLQEQVREELRGRGEMRRASPLQRTTPTRRKRTAGTITGARGGDRSSEEAESEGGWVL